MRKADVETSVRIRMAACTGKFKLTQSENFEEFMKALGVGLVTRKLGNKSSPTVTITEDSGEFTFKQESLVKTSEIKFKIGQEFDEVTADGRQGKPSCHVMSRDVTYILT